MSSGGCRRLPGRGEISDRPLLPIEWCPQNLYVEILTPSSMECDLIGSRVITDIIR